MNDILNNYFKWLCGLVKAPSHYKKLLLFLHDTDFQYRMARDSNRYEDGIDMRYQFGIATGESQRLIALALDNKSCSMLEMMVALADRCEEQIMSDSELGDRTGNWFWFMVDSLGLSDMTNDNFDKEYCIFVVNRFIEREYSQNGDGGLFRIDVRDKNNMIVDLRDYEIWYQATWYLNSVIEGGNK